MVELKPGQVLIFQGANLITQLQGDTNARHVAMVGKDPSRIWTTGAQAGLFFGRVNAESYLRGKQFIVAETVVPLTDAQLDIIEATNRAMNGEFYGFWKFAQLEGRAMRTGKVKFLGKRPEPKAIIQNPICSQAVGCPLWRAGVLIGRFQGKLDATGLLPENFEDEVDRGVLLRQVM